MYFFFFSSRRRHTRSVSAFLLNRSSDLKLLEEILSFRMQGVEFDNGDMYVDGHKAASDVRDEFVPVTEKIGRASCREREYTSEADGAVRSARGQPRADGLGRAGAVRQPR